MNNNRRLQLIQVSRNKQVGRWMLWIAQLSMACTWLFFFCWRREPSDFLNPRVSFFNKVVVAEVGHHNRGAERKGTSCLHFTNRIFHSFIMLF